MHNRKIPFNKPTLVGSELDYVYQACEQGQLAGDGKFTKKCQDLISSSIQAYRSLICHSCTAALEMSAILLNIKSGDEVILPSYTFVSTANAFVLRGATPVFVDISPANLCIDPDLVERAITPRTKAIVAVHYAGISCDMDKLNPIAHNHRLPIVEDAAQAYLSRYKERFLGSLGDIGAFSFHETKNIISGEGGAIVINNPEYYERAEIIREKGTNRARFFRGEIDKYTWVDIGSSFLAGELVSAFLLCQLENAIEINQMRMRIWDKYHQGLKDLEDAGLLKRPVLPLYSSHNAHMYYILLQDLSVRTRLIQHLNKSGVSPAFHYVPLHSSPAGHKYGRVASSMKFTESISQTLLRLPMGTNIDTGYVLELIHEFFYFASGDTKCAAL